LIYSSSEHQQGGNHRGAELSKSDLEAPAPTARIKFLLSTVEKLKETSRSNLEDLERRHLADEARLLAAIQNTSDLAVQKALEKTIASNKASLIETKKVYSDMASFGGSMSDLLSSANSKGSVCEINSCGDNAICTNTAEGSRCVCNEGFVGVDGKDCHPPPEFKAHRILHEGLAPLLQTSAHDMGVCVFGKNKIAIVFRDEAKGNIGRIVVGSVREAGLTDLAPPEQFTPEGGKAYNPVVQGSSDNRVLVAWRDEKRGGTGWMRAAAMGVTGIRGADMALTWGSSQNFAADQAHKIALVAMDQSRFALMYSDRTLATAQTPRESFGNALLAEVSTNGTVSSLGTFRFADSGVTRLEATRITPSSFVLAARASPLADDLNPNDTIKQEALAILGQVVNNDIVFNANPVRLDNATNIWGRGVSLISPNTFAYAYQKGEQQEMMMAVVYVNPDTHAMEVVQKPSVIRNGFSPYVSMLSVPYTASDPHTLMYYESSSSSMATVCSWAPEEKKIDQCEEFTWLTSKPRSVAGAHLGGGKSFMVFSTEEGVPYYSVFGLSRK
jgi:hypothetical protein